MLKSKFLLMRFVAVLGSTLIGLTFAISASAAPESVQVEVEFVGPIVIIENNPLQFGLLDETMALNDLVTIDPDGTVTESTPRVVGTGRGGPAPADLTVNAAVGRAITILVDAIVPNTGYTLETFVCNYNVGDGDCENGGAGLAQTSSASETLTIGATLRGDGGSVGAGVSDGSFDVTITYD